MKNIIFIIYNLLQLNWTKKLYIGPENKICLHSNAEYLYCWSKNELISQKQLDTKQKTLLSVGQDDICYISNQDAKKITCEKYENNKKEKYDSLFKDVVEISYGKDFICQSDSNIVRCKGPTQISVPLNLDSYQRFKSISGLKSNNENACVFQDFLGSQDKSLVCWGNPANKINEIPQELKDLPSLNNLTSEFVMGHDTVCITLNDLIHGHFQICWGMCPGGICTFPDVLDPNLTDLTIGSNHACAINRFKTHCWGTNDHGQATIPSEFSYHAQDLSAGHNLTCAIKGQTQRVQCWGMDPPEFMELRNTSLLLSLGGRHTCAVRRQVQECWGNNEFGQTDLAMEDFENGQYAISTGWDFTCQFNNREYVSCVGFNFHGQTDVPARLYDMFEEEDNQQEFIDIKSGLNHTCLIWVMNDLNRIDCWGGQNEQNQLYTIDVNFNTDFTIKLQAVGHDFTCISQEQANGYLIHCFGNNDNGQCEINNLGVQIEEVEQLAAGGAHGCQFYEEVLCWGSDKHGQGTVPGDKGMGISLSAGDSHTCGIDSFGHMHCWGMLMFQWDVNVKAILLSTNYENLCWIDKQSFIKCVGDDEQQQNQVPWQGKELSL